MIGKPFLLVFALLYVALLFLVAWRAERRKQWLPRYRPVIYALTLAVYCSSWTFFGAVGQAVNSTWSYLPIYLGPMLLFLFGGAFLRKLMLVSERQKVTSIADFIGSRYGKSQGLSALVTLLAIVGSLPYIALQLRALTMAWDAIGEGPAAGAPGGLDSAFATALMMGVFAMLFGTRHLEGRERNRGVVAAIALESVVKLFSFSAVAGLALWLLLGHERYTAVDLRLDPLVPDANFLIQTFLATTAIICLPRQFHMAVVEFQDSRDLRTARWLLPLYLGLFSLLILPIALAGRPLLAEGLLEPDSLVLTLPFTSGSNALTLLAYIGGFSAATGMVIVAAVTLAVMISNELVAPLWLFLSRFTSLSAAALGNHLRLIRRLSILVLLLMSWGMHRAITGVAPLASIGLLSFAAAAQLAPALIGALYWRRAHRLGVLAGLVAGYGLWFYCLVLPAVFPQHVLLTDGLFGLQWLRPQQLFGLTLLDPLSHGVLWSLLINILLFAAVSLLCRPRERDIRQAQAFVELSELDRGADLELTAIGVGQLKSLMQPFVGLERLEQIWSGFEQRSGQRLLADDAVPRFAVAEAESILAGIVGSATAHQVMDLLRANRPFQLEDIARLVDGTSQKLRFSQELLQTTVETLSQGISVVDADLRLVAWNQHYIELFDYPPRLLYIGCPVEKLYRHNAERGLYGKGVDIEVEIERRLQLLRHGSAHRFERRLPNGTIVEVRGTPMPGGGFVTTFSDISDYRAAVDALEENRRTLEERVEQRTAELRASNEALQAENRRRAEVEAQMRELHAAKTRFLAHTSHDLLQPINAARLFIASAQQKAGSGVSSEMLEDIGHIDSALGAAEQLIGALREISRLDSGNLTPKYEHFAVGELLDALTVECQAIAASRGLQLRYVRSAAWVYSDRHLLRRILQNFLSNALRYTVRGKVLLGARRRGRELEIQVWDTGPGIACEVQEKIFEEFVRLSSADRPADKGLGLGLAIAKRSADLLRHPIRVRSTPGRGAVFSIRVPLGVALADKPKAPQPRIAGADLSGIRVLCIDNEDSILRGMQSLLSGWGCRVSAARSLQEALSVWPGTQPPQLVIVDYHLDCDATGIGALEGLSEHWGQPLPGILISADISEQVRDAAVSRGYFYLSKPVKPAALRNLVRRLARRQPQAVDS
ncbi:PAS domain-containing hybrid sensor histidine kinase/response regulator [Microbulbifer thermotolerans]|uniref:PAS domain-containing hybrid sensor histidine kinase/response regulator n=1 Tax=Microbulbifer thermotolerans TaxID=252514 RepID=UPI00224A7007|nr:NahK/ErcS family hybrid sensor histidine kinase/response regulator [Microbulbifer thermotolerans]MCX2835415.1 PAS-domain containing protein [Microbulbifer thermotolerans]